MTLCPLTRAFDLFDLYCFTLTQFIDTWAPNECTPWESVRHTRYFEEKCHPNRLLLIIHDGIEATDSTEFYVESINKDEEGWYVDIMYKDPLFGWTIDNIESIDEWLNQSVPMEAHLDRIARFKSIQS